MCITSLVCGGMSILLCLSLWWSPCVCVCVRSNRLVCIGSRAPIGDRWVIQCVLCSGMWIVKGSSHGPDYVSLMQELAASFSVIYTHKHYSGWGNWFLHRVPVWSVYWDWSVAGGLGMTDSVPARRQHSHRQHTGMADWQIDSWQAEDRHIHTHKTWC